MNEINWEEEAERINGYADWEVFPTKESVLEYIEVIIAINGFDDLFSNEKEIMEYVYENG